MNLVTAQAAVERISGEKQALVYLLYRKVSCISLWCSYSHPDKLINQHKNAEADLSLSLPLV